MQVTIGSAIRVEDPTEELKRWCVDNLVMLNPEYAKKKRMNFWLGNTPQVLHLYEKHGDTLILPFGILTKITELLNGADIYTDFMNKSYINYNCDVPLYDYQSAAVEEMLTHHNGILKAPAGSGKTQMGIAMISMLKGRALWLTHTKDLLTQSMERAKQYMSSDLIGTITEGKINLGEGVTFATIQTMSKLDLTQYKYYWDVIIVDECHRVTGTPTAITQFYKVLNNLAARYKFGLSATVHRADQTIQATYALLGEVAYAVPDEAVEKTVMKVGIKTVYTKTKLSPECLNTDGTLNYTKLISYLCSNTDRNKTIIEAIKKEQEKPSLILSDRISQLKILINMMPKKLQDKAIIITGKDKKEYRDKALEDMRTGKKLYLFATYSLAKEGLDIPCLERLFMATPVKDYAVVTQAIGRIARTCEGKTAAVNYDFVDDVRYLANAYVKRCGIYRKNGCHFMEER